MYFRQLSISSTFAVSPLPEEFKTTVDCSKVGKLARASKERRAGYLHTVAQAVCVLQKFLCSWSAFKTSEHRKKSFPEGEPNASWSETYAALLQ